MQARSKARLRLMVAVRSQVGGVELWLQTWTRVRVWARVWESPSFVSRPSQPSLRAVTYLPLEVEGDQLEGRGALLVHLLFKVEEILEGRARAPQPQSWEGRQVAHL